MDFELADVLVHGRVRTLQARRGITRLRGWFTLQLRRVDALAERQTDAFAFRSEGVRRSAVSGPGLPRHLLRCREPRRRPPQIPVSLLRNRTKILNELCSRKRRWVAENIYRPFAVYYDPFTQTAEIVDHVSKIEKATKQLETDLSSIRTALRVFN